jgi:hypothetical protein
MIEYLFDDFNYNAKRSKMMQTISAGSINERGFINSLDRQGFTLTKSGCEMIANSADACSSKILFINNYPENITIIDDGSGMTMEKLINMVDIFRENNADRQSMGVSGMGGSAASFQLSKSQPGHPTAVSVRTKHRSGGFLKAHCPWDTIFETGVFTGQVKISEMTTDEIDEFIAERNENGMFVSGTTFIFHYSERVSHLLDKQFAKIENPLELKDSWGVVFGKIDASIMYDKKDGRGFTELKKYDYFCGSENEYYTGKFHHTIFHIHERGVSRFICTNPDNENEYLEITKETKGWGKKPKPARIHPMLLENADTITFTSGMRIDNAIFDVNHPREIDATYRVNSYDLQFMSEHASTQQFCGEISIYRNNQRITGFIPEGYSLSSARGNGDSIVKYIYHRVRLEYKVYSKQNNQMDMIHGIQQNKNQNQNEFPKNYSRLVKFLKDWHYSRIKSYMNELIQSSAPPVVEPPVVVEPPIGIEPPIVVVEPPIGIEPPVVVAEPEVVVVEPPVVVVDEPEVVVVDEPEVVVVEPPAVVGTEEVVMVIQDARVDESKTEVFEEPPKQDEELVEETSLEGLSSSGEQSPVIVPRYSENNEVEESRNYLRLAAKQIMDIAADPAYRGMNGRDIYELVQDLLLR